MKVKEQLKYHLEQLPIFTKEEIEIIVEASIVKEFRKGDVLLKEGQIPTQCFMVVKGCIREFILVEGEEKTIAFYTEGEKATSYSNKDINRPSKHFLECTENCVLSISTQNFEDDLRKLVPRLDVIIQEIAKEQIGKSKEQFTKFISSTPEQRYKELLETRPSIFNRVPQHQIASYLGVKPQSLSRIRKRILRKLKTEKDHKEKKLEHNGHTLKVDAVQ